MAGANYMGGRRNTARTRTKDVAGRMQRGHFMKQKHQILVQGLRDHSLDDTNEPRSGKSGRIEEISFAHAQRDLQSGQGGIEQKTFIQPRIPSKGFSQSSSSPGPSKQSLLRRSKVLENLDINDPSGLKVTLRRLCRLPDLAGLNSFNDSPHPDKHMHSKRPLVATEISRKKQKTDEHTSSSSSSFRYDSPTRRGTSNHAPLPLKSESGRISLPITHRQVNSPIRSSVQQVTTLHENHSSSNDSPDSLDGFSTIQELGSGVKYPDSGFSELLFTDDLEPEDRGYLDPRLDTPERWNTEHDYPESPYNLSKDIHIRSSTLKMTECQAIPQLTSQIPKAQEIPRDCSLYTTTTQPPELQSCPISSMTTPEQCFSLDEIFDKRFSSEENCDQDELQDWLDGRMRFGVGYVPPDPYVKYKPFVPLSTMLPSYSDEEDENVHLNPECMENDVNCSQHSGSGEAMDLDDQLSSTTHKSDHSASFEPSSFNSPTSSSGHGRYRHLLSQSVFITPTRQKSPLSVHRNRLQSRHRLSPIEYDGVSDILGLTTNSTSIIPSNQKICFSQIHSSSFTRSSSPFRSPVARRTHYSPLFPKTSSRRPITPRWKSSATFHSPLLTHSRTRSSECSVSSTVPNLLSADRNPGISRQHITPPLVTSEANRIKNHHLGSGNVEGSAMDALTDTLKFFDGPDLFGGDDDDD